MIRLFLGDDCSGRVGAADNAFSDTMSYVVKPAEKRHLESFPSIERAAAEMFSLKDLPLQLRSELTSMDVFQDAMRNGLLWVAVNESDAAIGFLLADIVDGNFHIKEMDVHPDHAGRGLGTKLLYCAFCAASEQNYRYITLTTFEHIQWNAPFYRRHGFTVMRERHCGKKLSAIIAEERKRGLKNRIVMYRKVSLENP